MLRQWWRGFLVWLAGPDISLAIIPLASGMISGTRKLRKALRDVRDRAARQDHRWQSVAMAGLAEDSRLLILVQHPSVDRNEVCSMFERRWPEVLLCAPGTIEPSSLMTVNDAAVLARRRRGIEPLRIVVMPQLAAAAPWRKDSGDLPMPMLF